MNICGVLVHAVPERTDEVSRALAGLPGVEIHRFADDGRIVVSVEDQGGHLALDSLTAIHRLPGVVAASLVYHHFDAADDSRLAT